MAAYLVEQGASLAAVDKVLDFTIIHFTQTDSYCRMETRHYTVLLRRDTRMWLHIWRNTALRTHPGGRPGRKREQERLWISSVFNISYTVHNIIPPSLCHLDAHFHRTGLCRGLWTLFVSFLQRWKGTVCGPTSLLFPSSKFFWICLQREQSQLPWCARWSPFVPSLESPF